MRRLATTLGLCGAFALGACGGDDTLSTEEYRDQARRICADAARATEAVQRPTRTSNAAIASYFERLVSVNRRTSEQFAALEPPEELERAHGQALAANRTGVREVERLIAELERGGDARALLQGAQARLEELTRRSAEAARALGVPECARQE